MARIPEKLATQFANKDLPRGIRNNNPGNIDWNANNDWQGQVYRQDIPDTLRDVRFAQFYDAKFGIRALMKLLQNYKKKYNLSTPRQIIGRWAPSNENDTAAYAKAVATRLGITIDTTVDMNSGPTLIAFAKAVVEHENGKAYKDFYGDDIYALAVSLL